MRLRTTTRMVTYHPLLVTTTLLEQQHQRLPFLIPELQGLIRSTGATTGKGVLMVIIIVTVTNALVAQTLHQDSPT